eukprot:8976476-Alexandrium_andersonii.AAC.1
MEPGPLGAGCGARLPRIGPPGTCRGCGVRSLGGAARPRAMCLLGQECPRPGLRRWDLAGGHGPFSLRSRWRLRQVA